MKQFIRFDKIAPYLTEPLVLAGLSGTGYPPRPERFKDVQKFGKTFGAGYGRAADKRFA